LDRNELLLKSLKRQRPPEIPVSVGVLPAAWMKYRDALSAIVKRHPGVACHDPNGEYDNVGGTYVVGKHVDAWGCEWSNIHTGMEAQVTGHPCPRREDIWKLRPPEVDEGLPHGFMFLRLTYLRGYEEAMLDFAEEPPELTRMLEIVRDYNVGQMRKKVAKIPPGREAIVHVGDDLGLQKSLPISPAKWRKHLKPCFRAIFAPVREAGHHVYLHTDGHILEIIPDLIEVGVEVVNPQFRANGLDGLRKMCFGKVCVDLDLDRQMFPFCSPADIHAHIKEAVEKLGSPEGGLWLKAEIGPDVPLPNVEAIFEALDRARSAFAAQ
jgi:uroporphyrinogen decarboxylase